MSDNMEVFKIGRSQGTTEFLGNSPETNLAMHNFIYFGDPKVIEYGERDILSVRKFIERGNGGTGAIKVLGLFDKEQYRLTPTELAVPKDRDMTVYDHETFDEIEKLVKKAYKTEEKLDF
jgi:hypothetical protein